jgi:hypothetical protein
MDLVAFQHFLADAADDGIKQRGCLTDPARQRRAVDIQALGGHHLGLPIKRQMIVELRNDDMRQGCKCRLSACDRLHRGRRLDDLLTRPAAIFRSDAPHHALVHRQDVEHLVCILPRDGVAHRRSPGMRRRRRRVRRRPPRVAGGRVTHGLVPVARACLTRPRQSPGLRFLLPVPRAQVRAKRSRASASRRMRRTASAASAQSDHAVSR